jgi:hypothetical protein
MKNNVRAPVLKTREKKLQFAKILVWRTYSSEPRDSGLKASVKNCDSRLEQAKSSLFDIGVIVTSTTCENRAGKACPTNVVLVCRSVSLPRAVYWDRAY